MLRLTENRVLGSVGYRPAFQPYRWFLLALMLLNLPVVSNASFAGYPQEAVSTSKLGRAEVIVDIRSGLSLG